MSQEHENEPIELTMNQFNLIMQKIERDHKFGIPRQKGWIKYVRPSFDVRDGMCFSITFVHEGHPYLFDTRTNTNTMYVDIISWLDTLQ